ncbi:hypothetical protein MRX96_049540 [Rhipicephalus microplus]
MRITARLLKDIGKMLDKYSRFHPSPLSIKQFIDFGENACEKTSFLFLRKELPVRLANIMKEIHLLPENLLSMPSVELVRSWYERSFEEILEFENAGSDDQKAMTKFCEALIKIRNRHSNVVQTMAQGVIELKESHEPDPKTEHSIQYFLDRFYMNRISIRMLINQHTSLFGNENNTHPRHIGSIDRNCHVASIVEDAYENAKFLCDQYYLTSPGLRVEQCDGGLRTITLVSHAVRAFQELHESSEDLTIKLSDKGGGIPRSCTEMLFQYMYSTAPQPSASGLNSAPLAGYGYGLPLSRLYARYFRGDLILTSCEGYGTDALIYLKALSNEANEMLPVFNKTSSKHYSSAVGASDWIAPPPPAPAAPSPPGPSPHFQLAPQRRQAVCTCTQVLSAAQEQNSVNKQRAVMDCPTN